MLIIEPITVIVFWVRSPMSLKYMSFLASNLGAVKGCGWALNNSIDDHDHGDKLPSHLVSNYNSHTFLY